MIGPGVVVALITARLEERVPTLLGSYSGRDGLAAWQAPVPRIHADWPPMEVGLDLMPSLWTTEVSMNVATGAYRTDPDPLGASWAFRYTMTVDGYVQSVDEAAVAEQRRYLVTAVREALLMLPGLVADDGTGAPPAEFHAATVRVASWQERYSNVGAMQGALVAGFTCQFDVDTQERSATSPPPVGPVDHVHLDVENIPINVAVGP